MSATAKPGGRPVSLIPDEDGLVHAFVLDGQGGGESIGWDGIQRWRPEDGVLWVNVDYAGVGAQRWLALESGLAPLVREALLDRDPRPRATAVGDALLLIIRAINLDAGAQPEDMVSLRCWIEPRRMITLRHRPVRAVKQIARELQDGKGPRDAGELVVETIEKVLAPLVTVVDGIDDAVAHAEDEVLGAHGDALRGKIADLRRKTIALRRFVAPQREAFLRLATMELPLLEERHRARLREAADRLTRTVEELDAARDRAAVTHEEMASRLGEVTNKRLYVLSLITAVFLPLGFVTSLLGVNVGGIPGRDVEWGFWVLCGLFAAFVSIQLWLFRKWGWL